MFTPLIGGHVDAMAVSPGEATAHVQGGKLKVLAVMADTRASGFETVPTLKERGIDLSIGNLRGIELPRTTRQPVVEVVAELTHKVAHDNTFQEALRRGNLGFTYAEANDSEAMIHEKREFFRRVSRNLH